MLTPDFENPLPATATKKMDYDIVLATRNRHAVLSISVPIMLAQTRASCRLIVVDASDDHQRTRDIVEGSLRQSRSATKLYILQSRPGSSLQRNRGLERVQSPVVIFPDDDALWFPDTAESMMQVYERDEEQIIGCVALSASSVAPPGSFGSTIPPYQMEFRDRFARRMRGLVGAIEEKLLPDPVHPGIEWRGVWGGKAAPDWLRQRNAEECGPVYGYRMSFRTSVIRGIGGFDENLGRYAMFEDSDATIGALRQRVNVLATQARVYHYRSPEKRVSGSEFGMMAILNRAYVTCKHSHSDSRVRRILMRYLYYKILRYWAQTYSRYGRQRLKGALHALSHVKELTDAPADQLSLRYEQARKVVAERLAFCDCNE